MSNDLHVEISDLREDLKKEFIETSVKNKDEILASNDKLTKKIIHHDQESAFRRHFIKETNDTLSSHNTRLKTLEAQPA